MFEWMHHSSVLTPYLVRRITFGPECWLWIGDIGSGGYGRVRWDGRRRKAHRVIYELLVGPIPTGLTLDHLCRNRPCVNPQHLEPVTSQENVLRGNSPHAVNARKTHCVNGHEFNEANTWRRPGGGRDCRACHRIRQLEYLRRQARREREE